MFKDEMEKAFFKEMLSKGVPVKKELNFKDIYEVLETAAVDFNDCDVVFNENAIVMIDENSENFLTIKTEIEDAQRKIIFYTSGYGLAFEKADIIMRTVFLVVTTCVAQKVLDIKSTHTKKHSLNPSDCFDFDSDFV